MHGSVGDVLDEERFARRRHDTRHPLSEPGPLAKLDVRQEAARGREIQGIRLRGAKHHGASLRLQVIADHGQQAVDQWPGIAGGVVEGERPFQ